jgi:hypothetical protein
VYSLRPRISIAVGVRGTILIRFVENGATFVSAFGPTRVLSQRVNQCCVSLIWMVMQEEYTKVYPGSDERMPYVQRGGGYCISLHLSAYVGVTSCERGNRSHILERK